MCRIVVVGRGVLVVGFWLVGLVFVVCVLFVVGVVDWRYVVFGVVV